MCEEDHCDKPRRWLRLLCIIIPVPMVIFILLELMLLALIRKESSTGRLFGTTLDEEQQEQMQKSLLYYLLGSLSFMGVWYSARWRPVCGAICLLIWSTFAMCGHMLMAMAFDAMCYMCYTWLTGSVEPFKFSTDTTNHCAFITKLTVQFFYLSLTIACYSVLKTLPFSHLRKAPQVRHDEDSSTIPKSKRKKLFCFLKSLFQSKDKSTPLPLLNPRAG